MGQIFVPASGGINVAPTDREAGPGAGSGATGNRSLFLGSNAGLNSTLSDNIVLGNEAEHGGAASTVGSGTIVIGSQAAQATSIIYDRSSSDSTATGPALIIGFNAAQSLNTLPNTVVIGPNALAALVNTGSIQSIWNNTVIGARAVSLPATNSASTFFADNVIIGARAGLGSAGVLVNHIHNVFIGSRVASGFGSAAGASVSDNTVIGYNAASTMGSSGNPANCVIIGASACPVWTAATNCVAIGQNTEIGNGGSAIIHDNTVVGASAQCNGGADNTILGSHTSDALVPTGSRWILLGRGAGAGETVSNNDIVVIETVAGGVHRAVLYSAGGTGNIVLGNSAVGTNRGFGGTPGTNMLKLMDGTPNTGANVSGGGYFYGSSGSLHWVDTAGVDGALGTAGARFTGTGTGVIDPAGMNATENNYAPAGFAAAQVVRLTPNAAGTTMTGLAGGVAGRMVTIINNGTGPNITLTNLDAGSSAANQFATPGAAALVIAQNSAVQLWYDSTGPHWHALSWS